MSNPLPRLVARRLLQQSDAARGRLVLPADSPIVAIDGDGLCRVLLVGSGLAAGVGVHSHRDALTGSLARHLARHGRGAVVESRGTVHSFLSDVPTLLESVPRGPIDVVVVSTGMMEAIAMTSDRIWERWLLAVLEMVHSRYGAAVIVVLAGMPNPSTAVLTGVGRRARFVDHRAAELNSASRQMMSRQPNWFFVELEDAEHICGQPSMAAYATWSGQIGRAINPSKTSPTG